MIDRLLATQWWNYDPHSLLNFDFSSPEAFIEQFSSAKLEPVSYSRWRIYGRGKRIERLNTPS